MKKVISILLSVIIVLSVFCIIPMSSSALVVEDKGLAYEQTPEKENQYKNKIQNLYESKNTELSPEDFAVYLSDENTATENRDKTLASTGANILTSGSFKYEITENNTAMIDEYTGTHSELVIPSTLGGYPVEIINSFAFINNDTLIKLTIPDSVKYVASYGVYNCVALKEVIIPDSILYIPEYAFGYYYDSVSYEAKMSNYTIYGYPCSGAAVYACEYSFKFIYISPKTFTTITENNQAIAFNDSITTISYFSFTPTKTSYYFVDIQLSDEVFCYESVNGIGYAKESTYAKRDLKQYVAGYTYWFSFFTPNSVDKVASAVTITDSGITKITAAQTGPVYFGDYYKYKSDLPIKYTVYSGDEVVFSGDYEHLENIYKMGFRNDYYNHTCSYLYTSGAGFEFGDLAFESSYNVQPSPVVSMEVIDTNDFVYIHKDIDHCYLDEETGIYRYYESKLLSNITLKIKYNTGKTKIWQGNGVSCFLDNAEIKVTSDQENTPWTVGGENIATVEYRGKTQNISVEVIDTPVESIELVENCEITEYKNGCFDSQSKDTYSYFFNHYLAENPLDFKVKYLDGSEEIITASSVQNYTDNGIYFELNCDTSKWNVGPDNSFTISYKGYESEQYISMVENQEVDLLTDFEILSIPDYDYNHISGVVDLSGVTIEATLLSGAKDIVTIEDSSAYGFVTLEIGGALYRCEITEDIKSDVTNVSLTINTVTKDVLSYKTGSIITGFEVVSIPDDNFVAGTKLKLTYDDGTSVVTELLEYTPTFETVDFALTDKGFWIPVKITGDTLDGQALTYVFCEDVVYEYLADDDKCTSKAAAYLIGGAFDSFEQFPQQDSVEYIDAVINASMAMQVDTLLYFYNIPLADMKSYVSQYFDIDTDLLKKSSYYNEVSKGFNFSHYLIMWFEDNYVKLVYEGEDFYLYLYDDKSAGSNYVQLQKGTNKVLYVGENPPSLTDIPGDANGDSVVNILDVTCIQKYLAKVQMDYFNLSVCDVDGNGKVDILDATYIQKVLAGVQV